MDQSLLITKVFRRFMGRSVYCHIALLKPDVEFLMSCSKGTYVRQLAEDVGEVLGCGACISQIERTKVGPFDIKDAVTLENLNEGHILKPQL